ncbi:MAG: hypothetical protein AAGC60_18095 [Acidobacteriota bacterium]
MASSTHRESPGLHCSGSRLFNDVRISWWCDGDCTVQVSYRGQTYVDVRLSADHPTVPFSAYTEQNQFLFSGQITYDVDVPALILVRLKTNTGPEVTDVVLCPSGSHHGGDEHADEPAPPEVGVEIVGGGEDLFPYIDLRPWPSASEEELENRFVAYDPPDPAPDFYTQLAALKEDGERLQMEELAVAFVEGEDPWQGQFVARLCDLGWPLDRFSALDAHLRHQRDLDLASFVREVETFLGVSWSELLEIVQSQTFLEQLDRAWQSLFALSVLLGFDRHLLDGLIRTVVMARLLQRIAALDADDPSSMETTVETVDGDQDPLDDAGAWSRDEEEDEEEDEDDVYEAEETEDWEDWEDDEEDPGEPSPCDSFEPVVTRIVLREGVRATVILPVEIFPLPPMAPPETSQNAAVSPSRSQALAEADPARSGIVPYAIGDLKLVRRRLSRYVLGEVSRIDNVAAGEEKETTLRNRTMSTSASEDGERSTSESSESTDSSRLDFTAQLETHLESTFDFEYSTTYGPPQDETASGYLRTGADGTTPATLDDTRSSTEFAEAVTQVAGQRTAREVWKRRATSSLEEREETVIHRVDARGKERNSRAIYRWVNKIYEAWVENVGRRLILEVFVKDPARHFIAAASSLAGVDLTRPTPPAELGLDTFLDVSRNASSPLFYATLAAEYEVSDIEPPPAPQSSVSTSFESADTATSRQLELPAGYDASGAWASLASSDASLTVQGVIGRTPFTATVAAGDTMADDSPPITLNGETGSLTVSIVPPSAASGGTSDDHNASDDGADGEENGGTESGGTESETETSWTLGVEVEAELGQQALDEWKLTTYRALIAGYERQKALYFETTGASPQPAQQMNPLAALEIVRRSLRKDVMRKLLAKAHGRLGTDPELFIDEPRYLQFFEQAFEWDDMSYSFTVRTSSDGSTSLTTQTGGEHGPFTTFLEAGWARILLPVDPKRLFSVPFFFASGLLWPGPDRLAPAFTQSVDLLNELKSAGPERRRPERDGEPWTLEVPTPMVILQESNELPRFPSDPPGDSSGRSSP